MVAITHSARRLLLHPPRGKQRGVQGPEDRDIRLARQAEPALDRPDRRPGDEPRCDVGHHLVRQPLDLERQVQPAGPQQLPAGLEEVVAELFD